MIDNLRHSKSCEAAWIIPKLLDIAVHAGPASSDDEVAFIRVMFDPALPTERGHPKAVDENNGGNVHRENCLRCAGRSPGNSSVTGGGKLNAARRLMSSALCL